MKAKKKRTRTKAKFKALKGWDYAAFLALILLIVVFSAYFTYTYLNQPPNQTINPVSSQSKAAIVDQLSLTFPNQTFIQEVTNTLKQAGYAVDYYPGQKVTVEFYRNLPAQGYGIIILRVHSALADDNGPPLCLFTAEPYSTSKYVYAQLSDRLVSVHYREGDKEQVYFGIFPSFVKSSMNGRFRNSTIIMMGCNGLRYTDMAQAFIEKGAKVYISWNASVSASNTDLAATNLLKHFLTERETLKQSIQETYNEGGFDPTENSQLTLYPPEAGEQTIENIGKG